MHFKVQSRLIFINCLERIFIRENLDPLPVLDNKSAGVKIMEGPDSTNSSTLRIQVNAPLVGDVSASNERGRDQSPSPRGSLLETGSTNVARSNSMRASRWDEAMPKDLEPRPPTRPVRKTISRSLSPRPRKPISLASLRPPPPSPTWSVGQGGSTTPTMLLPTRSPTPPQMCTGSNTSSTKPSPIHININNKHLETFTSSGWSSAPTTPTSSRKTLDVPGRTGSRGGGKLQDNAFLRNDRSTSTSPTGESLCGSSRIPRIENHTRNSLRTDSTSPSRYLDNLSSRQKRGVSPVVIYDKNNDKYTSPLILDIRKKQEGEEKNIGGVKSSTLTPPTNRKLGSSSHDCNDNDNSKCKVNLNQERKPVRAPSPMNGRANTALKSASSTLTPPTIRKIGASSSTKSSPSSSPSSSRKIPSTSKLRPSTPTSSNPHVQNVSTSPSAQNLYLTPSPKSPSLINKIKKTSGRLKYFHMVSYTYKTTTLRTRG